MIFTESLSNRVKQLLEERAEESLLDNMVEILNISVRSFYLDLDGRPTAVIEFYHQDDITKQRVQLVSITMAIEEVKKELESNPELKSQYLLELHQ